jgi:hypothetical protein
MATTKARKPKLTPAVTRKITAQLARQLGVSWAVIRRDTNKLITVRPSRAAAREYVGRDRGLLRIIRVDLKIHGLRA